MRKAIVGMLLALGVLGAAAGLSGREMANAELERLKARWAELHALPVTKRPVSELAELRLEARDLAARYPGREEIRSWERVIERTTENWRAVPENAS